MNVAILTCASQLYTTQRLADEIQTLGHKASLINTKDCELRGYEQEPDVIYHGKSLKRYQVVIPRISASVASFGCAVVKHLQLMQVRVINSSLAIQKAHHKWQTAQAFIKRGIPTPKTVFLYRLETQRTQELVNYLQGFPLLLKTCAGTHGIGVIKIEDRFQLESMLCLLHQAGQEVILQAYIGESEGEDIRALVVGHRVIAAMQRTAQQGDFRSNIHRGGQALSIELTKEEQHIAEQATRSIGLKVAGVDLMRSKQGPLVIEINACPGIQGLERVTQKNLAQSIAQYACKK